MIDPHRTRTHAASSPPAPGTIRRPSPKTPGRLDARRTHAIDQLAGHVSKAARRRMQSILHPFPTGELEALHAKGVRFEITKAPSEAQKAVSKDGLQMLGGYNLITRQIQLMESTLLGEDGPHTVVHELCHAIDHMRGDRLREPSGTPSDNLQRARANALNESSLSPEVHALYQRYQARGGVEDVAALRDELRESHADAQSGLPRSARFTSTFDGWGPRPVRYERKDGVETFVIDSVKKAGKAPLVLGGGAGAAIAAAGLLFPPIAPVAFGLGGLLAGTALLETAQRITHKHKTSTSEVEVPLQGSATAHVIQRDERTVISLPEDAEPNEGDIWSPYAHRGSRGQENRGVVEYTAEAYSTYLEGGRKAREMRDRDPEMYAFVEKRLHDEFNLHP